MYNSNKNILVFADSAERANEAVKIVMRWKPCPQQAIVTFLAVLPVLNNIQHNFQGVTNLKGEFDQYEDCFKEAEKYLDIFHIQHKKMIRMGNPSQEITLITQLDSYDILLLANRESEKMSKLISHKVRCPVFTLLKNKGH